MSRASALGRIFRGAASWSVTCTRTAYDPLQPPAPISLDQIYRADEIQPLSIMSALLTRHRAFRPLDADPLKLRLT